MTRLNRVLFFGIAGFLFGIGAPFSLESLLKKLRNRFWTIFVPYLFSIILIAIGILAGIHTLGADFVARSPMLSAVSNLTDRELECLLMIRYKAGVHLWFIESLMLNILAFGLFFIASRWNLFAHLVVSFAAAVGLVLLSNQYIEGAFYFSVGTLVSRWAWILEIKDRRLWVLSVKLGLWLISLFFYIREQNDGSGISFPILRVIQSGLGASLVWQAVDFFPQAVVNFLLAVAPYTFPVFLLHSPFLIGWLRHGYIRIMPSSTESYACAWLFVGVLTYIVSFLVAKAIERISPRCAALVFGGRGAARKNS